MRRSDPTNTPPRVVPKAVPEWFSNTLRCTREQSGSPVPPPSGGNHSASTPPSGSQKRFSQPEQAPTFNPGTTWLITPRTTPAWTAALHILDDNNWHPTQDLADAMHAAGDLAPRTITNHLRSASRRSWITNRRGRTKLRDRDLLEAALDAQELDQ